VLGWPVSHSRSPAIQNAALAATGLQNWRYQLLPVPPSCFIETAQALGGAGLRGANVTIPHKLEALALSDARTPRAEAIGAANTLVFEEDGTIFADNTDAPGLISLLPFDVADRTALILGAGGSARAALWALLDAGAREVRVWSRTFDRALQLCEALGGTPVREPSEADVLIHCTPVGLHAANGVADELPLGQALLGSFGCVVDFVYREGGTPLASAARARGIPVIDGLELLVAQGALSFEQFTGVAAPVADMREAAGLRL
jgi:shikimate dehydrogenase